MKSLNLCFLIFVFVLTGCKELKYSTNTPTKKENIVMNISNSDWFTSNLKTSNAMVGKVNLAIKGHTNAELLTVRKYGDGKISDQELKIDTNGMFNDTIEISFTYFSSPPDYSVSKYSKTLLKAYLGKETMDTTLISDPLFYKKD